ncbi:MAG: electron transfer flavoprotein subunit alpha/FixB family protein [Desulfuromonas sp.]|nr:electron transfer flavoprotein subunit alpha/FixB family protein [Desulfuromonas sp.]
MSPKGFQVSGKSPNIVVFVDFPGAKLDDYGKGVLTEASRLANVLGSEWSVLSFGEPAAESIEALAPYGVEKLTLIKSDEKLLDSVDVQARLLALATEQEDASLLLLPHNDLGATLAPLLTNELQAALFTETIAYANDGEKLTLSRKILGAQVAEMKCWDARSKLVLTVSPEILSTVVLPSVKPGSVQVERWQPPTVAPGVTRIIERIAADPQTVDLVDAEVIVSAGLGCNDEAIGQVKELVQLLNASLGVTRPAYDLGYTGFERMVGQTGKTVAPQFYLALGISGSMHHLGGMKDSKRIVSVNIDPKAPIVANSDEGFVADLRELLPLLIERVKSAVGGSL